ncbi:hypothetical protein ACFVT8_01410 [Lysinibacillus sp. NPDC058147]|uniref:hypothetical protein n=1 Tax=unclassified Lysinibacillus TaxID=2636778 RepID=UPI0036DD6B36
MVAKIRKGCFNEPVRVDRFGLGLFPWTLGSLPISQKGKNPTIDITIYVIVTIYQSILLNERNIDYYPYLKYWVYDNIYLNLLTLNNMKGSVIFRYEKDIETID